MIFWFLLIVKKVYICYKNKFCLYLIIRKYSCYKAVTMRWLYLLMFPVLFVINSFSQDFNWQYVSIDNADIEQFIKNFPQIEKEFKVADLDYSTRNDLDAFLNGVAVNNEAEQILKKYGYSGVYEFAGKTWTIAMGYASLKLQDEGMPAYEQAIAEINANEDMSDEQKEMALQQIELMKSSLTTAMPGLEDEELINKIRPYEEALDKMFE